MEKTFKLADSLQKQLHQIPEASGCETKTKNCLIGFLKTESCFMPLASVMVMPCTWLTWIPTILVMR